MAPKIDREEGAKKRLVFRHLLLDEERGRVELMRWAGAPFRAFTPIRASAIDARTNAGGGEAPHTHQADCKVFVDNQLRQQSLA